MFALVDATDQLQEVRINDDGLSFKPIPAVARASTEVGLPSAGNSGWLRRVSDGVRGIWMDSGTNWFPLITSVNVREFGARGDGVTDDTAAFQAAADALLATGGILTVPLGTYILKQVRIHSKTWVRGSGAGTTILKNTSTETTNDGVIRNNNIVSGNSYLKISALTVQRTQQLLAGSAFHEFILAYNCDHVWVEDCAFLGPGVPSPPVTTGAKGVHMRGTQYSWILNNYFLDIPDTPIAINGKDTLPANTPMYALVSGNQIEQTLNWQSSIIIVTAPRVKILANTFHSPVQQDSTFLVEIGSNGTSYAASDIDIIGNTVINANLFVCINQYQRVLIAQNRGLTEGAGTTAGTIYQPTLVQSGTLPRDLTILGNQIQGGSINLSIYPGTLTGALIAQNHMVAPVGGAGIAVGSTDRLVLEGNIVINSQGGGIRVGGDVTNAVIQHNVAVGGGLGGFGPQGQKEGFYFENVGGVIANNISRSNTGYGFWFEQPNGLRFLDNQSMNDVAGTLNVTNATLRTTNPFPLVRHVGPGRPGADVGLHAGVGSMWIRNDGNGTTTGGTIYMKYSGTDTTGWRRIELTASEGV